MTARDGAIIFRYVVGKLTVLRIECEKCRRSGQYRLDRLIMRYGIDAERRRRLPHSSVGVRAAQNMDADEGGILRIEGAPPVVAFVLQQQASAADAKQSSKSAF